MKVEQLSDLSLSHHIAFALEDANNHSPIDRQQLSLHFKELQRRVQKILDEKLSTPSTSAKPSKPRK